MGFPMVLDIDGRIPRLAPTCYPQNPHGFLRAPPHRRLSNSVLGALVAPSNRALKDAGHLRRKVTGEKCVAQNDDFRMLWKIGNESLEERGGGGTMLCITSFEGSCTECMECIVRCPTQRSLLHP